MLLQMNRKCFGSMEVISDVEMEGLGALLGETRGRRQSLDKEARKTEACSGIGIGARLRSS